MRYFLSIAFDHWKSTIPTLQKYIVSSREVHNIGTISRFSDKFGILDADVWKLEKAFRAYPEEYPGTLVSS